MPMRARTRWRRWRRQQAQSIWDIADHYKQAYWADVRALNIRQPAQWTVATDYVPQMIEFAKDREQALLRTR
jgi:cysteinyl-tRNA synthetase